MAAPPPRSTSTCNSIVCSSVMLHAAAAGCWAGLSRALSQCHHTPPASPTNLPHLRRCAAGITTAARTVQWCTTPKPTQPMTTAVSRKFTGVAVTWASREPALTSGTVGQQRMVCSVAPQQWIARSASHVQLAGLLGQCWRRWFHQQAVPTPTNLLPSQAVRS